MNGVGRPEGGALTDGSRAPPIGRRQTQPMKSHGLFVYYALPTSFPLYKIIASPCCAETCTWLPWLQNLNCNSLLIPKKPIFAGEISGSLFVSTIPQRYMYIHRGLNCVGPLNNGFFFFFNSKYYRTPRFIESMDAEPRIRRDNYIYC